MDSDVALFEIGVPPSNVDVILVETEIAAMGTCVALVDADVILLVFIGTFADVSVALMDKEDNIVID